MSARVYTDERGDWVCSGCRQRINPGVFQVLHERPRNAALHWIRSHRACVEQPVREYVSERGVHVIDRRRIVP
jgi:hypothetical protein